MVHEFWKSTSIWLSYRPRQKYIVASFSIHDVLFTLRLTNWPRLQSFNRLQLHIYRNEIRQTVDSHSLWTLGLLRYGEHLQSCPQSYTTGDSFRLQSHVHCQTEGSITATYTVARNWDTVENSYRHGYQVSLCQISFQQTRLWKRMKIAEWVILRDPSRTLLQCV